MWHFHPWAQCVNYRANRGWRRQGQWKLDQFNVIVAATHSSSSLAMLSFIEHWVCFFVQHRCAWHSALVWMEGSVLRTASQVTPPTPVLVWLASLESDAILVSLAHTLLTVFYWGASMSLRRTLPDQTKGPSNPVFCFHSDQVDAYEKPIWRTWSSTVKSRDVLPLILGINSHHDYNPLIALPYMNLSFWNNLSWPSPDFVVANSIAFVYPEFLQLHWLTLCSSIMRDGENFSMYIFIYLCHVPSLFFFFIN